MHIDPSFFFPFPRAFSIPNFSHGRIALPFENIQHDQLNLASIGRPWCQIPIDHLMVPHTHLRRWFFSQLAVVLPPSTFAGQLERHAAPMHNFVMLAAWHGICWGCLDLLSLACKMLCCCALGLGLPLFGPLQQIRARAIGSKLAQARMGKGPQGSGAKAGPSAGRPSSRLASRETLFRTAALPCFSPHSSIIAVQSICMQCPLHQPP